MKYTIYQLQVEDENSPGLKYKFWDWDKIQIRLKEDNLSIKDFINLYTKVYEGEIEPEKSDMDTLEKLYRIFNINHPEDFRGHSLSMSDIIELDNGLYICDMIGFTKVL